MGMDESLSAKDKREVKAICETLNLILKKSNIKELSYKVLSRDQHYSPMITEVTIIVGNRKPIKKTFRNGEYKHKDLFPNKFKK